MIIYTNKNYSTNLLRFSKEENYIINPKNNIVYSSFQKGISLEYIIDKALKDIKAIFVYENLENDEIALVFTNSNLKSIVFNIKNDFSTKKVENFIKLSCLKNNISKIYFFNDSIIREKIELPSYIKKSSIDRNWFKKAVKKSPSLKNNQNKIIFLLLSALITFGLSFSSEKLFTHLTYKSGVEFDKTFADMANNKIELEAELEKYENITLNLKEIRVVQNFNEYLEIKKAEESKLNNDLIDPNEINNPIEGL